MEALAAAAVLMVLLAVLVALGYLGKVLLGALVLLGAQQLGRALAGAVHLK
jgi:hypothetical protein